MRVRMSATSLSCSGTELFKVKTCAKLLQIAEKHIQEASMQALDTEPSYKEVLIQVYSAMEKDPLA